MSDLLCPRCRRGLIVLPASGSSVDYECENCGLSFGISSADRPALKHRPRGELLRDPMSGKLWLKPIRRGRKYQPPKGGEAHT